MQSLMMIITTAGKNAENNPCKKERDNLVKMLRGEIPMIETYFVMIRTLDDDDDPHDETKWIKANPILQEDNEYSRELLEQIKIEHDEAFNSGDPDKIREWLTKRVNRWQEDAENKYMSGIMDKWKALAVPRKEFMELIRGCEGWAGVDMSKRIDLTAAAHVFWLPDGRLAVTAHGFMPEETATKHEHTDRVPYRYWAKEGWCTLTPGAVTDYKYIANYLDEFEFDNGVKILEECYDPYNATHFMLERAAAGKEAIEISQNFLTLSEPTKYFRELVLQKRVVHDGSPLLTWCLSNAVEVADNNGNIKLSKKHKDDSQRIDLAAAVINAMVRAMTKEKKVDVSKYADADFLDKLWG